MLFEPGGRRLPFEEVVMKSLSVLIGTAVLVLELGGIAYATELFGGPLFPGTGRLTCMGVNLGTRDITVLTQIFDRDGVEVGNQEETIAPGHVGGISIGGALDPTYCRMSGNFSPRQFRATLTVGDVFGVTVAAGIELR
jgi:hypothetical protein